MGGLDFLCEDDLHVLFFARCLGEAFDHLDAPVLRVTGADIPTPYAKNLEELAFPRVETIVRTVKKSLERKQ